MLDRMAMPLVTVGDSFDPKWLDDSVADRLRIRLLAGPEHSPSGIEQLGEYQFLFRVTMPPVIPPYNVWSLSLCEGSGGCMSAEDSSVMVAFPIPGFSLGQAASAVGADSETSWTILGCGPKFWGVAVVVGSVVLVGVGGLG